MCVFCKIINGEIPSYKLYEDDNTIAILDISQATVGHTLVIPKKHYENIFTLDDETISSLSKTTLKVTNILKDKLHFSNVNILNNNGVLAGQSVNHYHIHIIPRYSKTDCNFSFVEHEPNFDELNELFKKLK